MVTSEKKPTSVEGIVLKFRCNIFCFFVSVTLKCLLVMLRQSKLTSVPLWRQTRPTARSLSIDFPVQIVAITFGEKV